MHFGSLEENVDRNYMERMVMFSPAFHCGVDLFGNGFGNGPGLAFTLGLCPKKWGDLSTGSGNLGTIWGPHEKVELQSHSPTMNSNHQNSLYPEPIRHQNISLQTHWSLYHDPVLHGKGLSTGTPRKIGAPLALRPGHSVRGHNALGLACGGKFPCFFAGKSTKMKVFHGEITQ
jgi:hypothetical protein